MQTARPGEFDPASSDSEEVRFNDSAMQSLAGQQDCGGVEGDRTPDLRLAKPALSQLSYNPKKETICRNKPHPAAA